MTIEVSYTDAKRKFASLLSRVTDDQEIIVIGRPGKKSVAMIAESELERLLDSVYRSGDGVEIRISWEQLTDARD